MTTSPQQHKRRGWNIMVIHSLVKFKFRAAPVPGGLKGLVVPALLSTPPNLGRGEFNLVTFSEMLCRCCGGFLRLPRYHET